MATTFKIIPLVDTVNENRWKFLREPLPRPPFRMLVTGSSGAGKTNAVMNLILRFLVHPRTKISVFDRILVFSPSLMQDPSFSVLGDETLINPDIVYAENILNKEVIDEVLKSNNGENILVFIDDFASDKKNLQDDILFSLFFRSRHANVSVIFNTQHHSQVPIQIRNNCNYMMLFRPTNNREASIIKQENETPEIHGDDFDYIYANATKEKYSFLYIDKSHGEPKFYVRFEYAVKSSTNTAVDASHHATAVKQASKPSDVKITNTTALWGATTNDEET